MTGMDDKQRVISIAFNSLEHTLKEHLDVIFATSNGQERLGVDDVRSALRKLRCRVRVMVINDACYAAWKLRHIVDAALPANERSYNHRSVAATSGMPSCMISPCTLTT